jgi:hypothetical protein
MRLGPGKQRAEGESQSRKAERSGGQAAGRQRSAGEQAPPRDGLAFEGAGHPGVT